MNMGKKPKLIETAVWMQYHFQLNSDSFIVAMHKEKPQSTRTKPAMTRNKDTMILTLTASPLNVASDHAYMN